MISKHDVLKSAALAKLTLTRQEEERFVKELAVIVEYVDKLKEVDTVGVEVLGHPLGLENSFREDHAASPGDAAQESGALLGQAPRHKDGFLIVPRIFTDL